MGVVAIGASAGCGATSSEREPRTALVELSSADEAYEWHLHARDGTLLCELPCEQWIGEHSGSYLAVHDPAKSWRIDLPSSLPGPPGSRVSMEPHAGKGSPAMGTVGTALGLVGAAAATVGIGLLFAGYIRLEYPEGLNLLGSGAILVPVGAVVGVPGVWLMEHNRASSVRVRVLPGGLVGTF